MELTDKVFSNITDSHQALIGIHSEKQAKSLNHAHTFVNPTDFNTGKMMYGENSTNYSIAQRMADVTGQPTKLIVCKEDETEKSTCCFERFIMRWKNVHSDVFFLIFTNCIFIRNKS